MRRVRAMELPSQLIVGVAISAGRVPRAEQGIIRWFLLRTSFSPEVDFRFSCLCLCLLKTLPSHCPRSVDGPWLRCGVGVGVCVVFTLAGVPGGNLVCISVFPLSQKEIVSFVLYINSERKTLLEL